MTDMMVRRQRALDGLADAHLPLDASFTDLVVDIAGRVQTGDRPERAVPVLAEAIAMRLLRGGGRAGPGAAVLRGLTAYFDIDAARAFHKQLFEAVWEVFRTRSELSSLDTTFRAKSAVIVDGAIPPEHYGSSWSFKEPHIDREVLLFSHLYGPVTGFSGGALRLIDIGPYMRRHQLRFSDVFAWSSEVTAGAKPVLREAHRERAYAECGVELAVGPDELVFVNNLPDAGILHGVTPVTVLDSSTFRREYHRCSVKEVS